jgi:hypothetical protein
LIVLCSTPAVVLADAIEQHKGPATLEVRFTPGEPKTRQIALSDTITVTLRIVGSPGWKITAPRKLPDTAPWLLVGEPVTTQEKLDLQRQRWQRVYLLAPRERGTLTLEFPELRIEKDDAEPQSIAWDPIIFTVTTRIAQPDRAGMREITDIEKPEAPPASTGSWYGWLALAVLPLLGALLVLARRWLRHTKTRVPAERALYEWQRLQEMKLPERGSSERFMTLLSLIVRDYVQRGLGLPARRQTTGELRVLLAPLLVLTDPQKSFLIAFLECADSVKFAHTAMLASECSRWSEKVREFLQERIDLPDKQTGQAPKNLPVEKSGQNR